MIGYKSGGSVVFTKQRFKKLAVLTFNKIMLVHELIVQRDYFAKFSKQKSKLRFSNLQRDSLV